MVGAGRTVWAKFVRGGIAVVLSASVVACEVPRAAPAAPDGNSVAGAAPAVPVGEARKLLGTLRVAVRGVLDGYDRDKFPHWKTVSGSCNVREELLKRAGGNVEVDAECNAVSGSWRSPYDGETWRKASDVDVDHVVPLAHAWVSGAKSWDQARREQFANDLTRPQLLVVTDNVNQEKGDKAPDEWKPPLVSFWCTYATDWIVVKAGYGLSITVPERTALTSMLDRCG
ncbi:HNH endonuclease family protein [Amycolatopsis alba]|uniref:HNH endonuclease n=1 Tax=Amycolatopsis alba DSM 44262 TaxID=1125972 RepID=A0A229S7T5_AMYAL|nr:HNH endonuclease family protein [Amycolatopsis alba]OXM54968.1 HNH endonuclease [Amycolatopsis alba DSM 44262]